MVFRIFPTVLSCRAVFAWWFDAQCGPRISIKHSLGTTVSVVTSDEKPPACKSMEVVVPLRATCTIVVIKCLASGSASQCFGRTMSEPHSLIKGSNVAIWWPWLLKIWTMDFKRKRSSAFIFWYWNWSCWPSRFAAVRRMQTLFESRRKRTGKWWY